MPCGMSTINLKFRNLKLSAYQPILEFPRASFLIHHKKVLNQLRSCIVVPAVNRVILESLVNEFEQNRSLSSIILSNTHIVQEIDIDKEFAEQIAKGITASASLTHIDLSSTKLRSEGAKHITDGISASASLTSINLNGNYIGVEGAKYIAEGISVSVSLRSIYLTRNELGDEGAKHIAKGIPDNASLTCLDVRSNGILGESAVQLSTSVLSHTKIQTFNAIPVKDLRSNSVELNLKYMQIGIDGAMVIAGLMPVSVSLTKVLFVRVAHVEATAACPSTVLPPSLLHRSSWEATSFASRRSTILDAVSTRLRESTLSHRPSLPAMH